MSHPPRLKKFDYIRRHRYFLTFCTYERRPWFIEPRKVDLVRAPMLRTAAAHHIAIHAHCFMPDHVHLLAEGRDDPADIRAFMNVFKQRSGWDFRRGCP